MAAARDDARDGVHGPRDGRDPGRDHRAGWHHRERGECGRRARNAASQAEATKQKQAADDGPPKPDTPPTKTKRCVLKPGKVYRLDVEMQWSGEMSHADDKGNKTVAAEQAADGSTLTTRSYWFRTAKARDQAAPFGMGTVAYVEHLYKRRDLFDPDMLVRHLRGYQPAQSELDRFADDPVRVHFAYGHVAALARAYGFDLLCGLRRLDAPEAGGARQLLRTRAPGSADCRLHHRAGEADRGGLSGISLWIGASGGGAAHAAPAHAQRMVRSVRAREVSEPEPGGGRPDPWRELPHLTLGRWRGNAEGAAISCQRPWEGRRWRPHPAGCGAGTEGHSR